MHVDLTEAERTVQAQARRFADERVAPSAQALERAGSWPADLVAWLAERRWLAPTLPREAGGAALGPVAHVVLIEELAAACPSLATLVGVQGALVCAPLAAQATDAQRAAYVEPLARGSAIGAFAWLDALPTEGSSSEASVRAQRADGGWRLQGTKRAVPCGPDADLLWVFAATDVDHAHSQGSQASAGSLSAFLVRVDTSGVRRAPLDAQIGSHAVRSCAITFDACLVPDEQRVGPVGAGASIAAQALDAMHLVLAAQAVGIARAALERAVAYAKSHHLDGAPLASKQAVQVRLADMATRVDAARLLTAQAALALEEARADMRAAVSSPLARQRADAWLAPRPIEVAMAKLFAAETAVAVTRQAQQLLGWEGGTVDETLDRLSREARATELRFGSSELLREQIGTATLAVPSMMNA